MTWTVRGVLDLWLTLSWRQQGFPTALACFKTSVTRANSGETCKSHSHCSYWVKLCHWIATKQPNSSSLALLIAPNRVEFLFHCFNWKQSEARGRWDFLPDLCLPVPWLSVKLSCRTFFKCQTLLSSYSRLSYGSHRSRTPTVWLSH